LLGGYVLCGWLAEPRGVRGRPFLRGAERERRGLGAMRCGLFLQPGLACPGSGGPV
jgi:hypothetical protein